MRSHSLFRYLKIALFLSLFFILFVSHKKTALAQARSAAPIEQVKTSVSKTQESSQMPAEAMRYKLNTNPDVPHNLNTYTQSVFFELFSTASCFLTGTNPINPHAKCLGVDSKNGKLTYAEPNNGGLVVAMGGLIAQTYNIPVSSTDYVGYLASNFGITRNSYAQINAYPPGSRAEGQGVGFIGLTPILGIWTVFRNLSYLLFVLVFVILGLGIMFRINLDARTVMTIQNQLPKIIVGILLITLSYAIAGFLIDLMYVATYLIINTFQSQGLQSLNNINTNPISAVGFFGNGIHSIAGPSATSIGSIIRSMFDGPIGTLVGAAVGTIIGAFLGSALGSLIPVPGGGAIGSVGGAALIGAAGTAGADYVVEYGARIIAYLIIVIAVLSSLFRVWFMCIKAYVYILIAVIFSPFWILAGLLPGGFGGFGPWIRSLLANLATFPVVVLLFMIGKTIIDTVNSSPPTAYNFTPPMIGSLGNDSTSAIASIIGLGVILIMPEALNLTKSVLKAPDFKLSSAAARPIAFAQRAAGFIPGQTWSRLTHQDPLKPWKGGTIARWAAGGVGGADDSRAKSWTRTLLRLRDDKP